MRPPPGRRSSDVQRIGRCPRLAGRAVRVSSHASGPAGAGRDARAGCGDAAGSFVERPHARPTGTAATTAALTTDAAGTTRAALATVAALAPISAGRVVRAVVGAAEAAVTA